MLFQVFIFGTERCEILHYSAQLYLKVLCGFRFQWLNFKSLLGPLVEHFQLNKKCLCSAFSESLLYLFLPGSRKPLAKGFLSIFSFVIWPRGEEQTRVRVDLSTVDVLKLTMSSAFTIEESGRAPPWDCISQQHPRRSAMSNRGSCRKGSGSFGFILCFNRPWTAAVGAVTARYCVSVITRSLIVK